MTLALWLPTPTVSLPRVSPLPAPRTAQTPVAFTSGGNPLLQPELSKSQTIGAVWSPTFVENLNFSLDWWKIRIADTIVADSPTQILNDCYISGITSRCSPALFTRDAALGYHVVSFGGRNAGFRKVEGFDFDVAYRLPTENWGNFSVVSNSTYTAKDYTVSTNDPRQALSSVGFTSTFRIRSNLNLGWEYGRVRHELDRPLLLVDEGRLHLPRSWRKRSQPRVQ